MSEFIQQLLDKDFPAAKMSFQGALREYKLVLELYDRLEQKKDETQLISNLSSRSRDPSLKEASPDVNEMNQTDADESDRKEDRMRISSYGLAVPHSSDKAHTPESVTDKTTEGVYDNDPGAAPKMGIDNKPAEETHRSRDLLRRSEEASLLLHQQNPNILDLSDTNRPTNLAERFSELYSNEYTDAFEFLQTQGQDEEYIVYDLLRIVRYAYKYCRQLASEELTKRIHNMLQERIASNETFTQKEFWNLIPNEIDPTNENLVTYAWNCVDIVWLMCVQDPPISMSWVKKGDTFDTSLYTAYTKNGSKVDFCVWPLVLLADSGPVLTKGIAQGK